MGTDGATGCTTPKYAYLPRFGEEALAELREICSDLDALFDAPTTTPRDRKELVRIMVDQVIVEERSRERVRMRIVWNDGAPDTEREMRLFPYAHRIIAEMSGQGAAADVVSDRLVREGVFTKARTQWTASAVSRKIARMRTL